MSEHPLYAVVNYHQKHISGKTSSETTDDDDATYSNIHSPAPGKSAQENGDRVRGGHCVIYTKVSLPNQDGVKPTAPTSPDDQSARTAAEERSHWRVLVQPTVLLLLLSALLLIVIFTLSAFYALSKISYTKRLYALEKKNSEARQQTIHLQTELLEMNNTLVQSQSALRNSSEEKTLLLHELTHTQMNFTQLLRNCTAISRERTDIQTKLDSLNIEARRKCAFDWEYFNKKCYYISTDVKSWAGSRDACVTMGGHLAIIESEGEQTYIKSRMQRWQQYWIGLHYLSGWHWIDNTRPESGQFQSHNRWECMLIAKSSWTTEKCYSKWQYICESKAID
ncbi:CD209 antigen-like protein B [Sardina pilchardus]|uniref:CD209 antigen-like protein B n=1 Tax=Sardina pilchardus TaxID=27697 RepID=UPI002E15B105